jgi:hypothetical protein
MTWAINEGGEAKPEVYQFLTNIGSAINTTPLKTATPRPPTGAYAPDLLPLMQQMAWACGDRGRPPAVELFLRTIAYYLTLTLPNLNTGPFLAPTMPPTPAAFQSMVQFNEIPALLQVAYWLINDGLLGNQKAWIFLESLGRRLNMPPRTTLPGQFHYPKKV